LVIFQPTENRLHLKMSGERFNYGDTYKKYRPTYPSQLYEIITEFIGNNEKETCVDLACGNGQSTAPLCHYFQKVIGIDPSESQIENATNKGKLSNC
jgi:tRNA/tmRNA/rRNA uracil-C5-methylase (TrmA/RlmC/RlmD family)